MKPQPETPQPTAQASRPSDRRGFVLILVVGMMAVLVVLGLSFAEAGRIQLMGATNTMDLGATDSLAETGFSMALWALHEDGSVNSLRNHAKLLPPPGTPSGAGASNWPAGVTSRWGYNPRYDKSTNEAEFKDLGTATASGTGPNSAGPAPNRSLANLASNPLQIRNFTDTWQTLFWNDDVRNNLQHQLFIFQFHHNKTPQDPEYPDSREAQRPPTDDRDLLDTWPLQPLASVKKFRIRQGNLFGVVQVAITPTDGGINVNDCMTPKMINELRSPYDPGDGNTSAGLDKRVLGSPGRRDLEHMLGRRPNYAYFNREYPNDGSNEVRSVQPFVNRISGPFFEDSGVYNFFQMTRPYGLGYAATSTAITPSSTILQYPWYGQVFVTNPSGAPANRPSPRIFYNSNPNEPYRYNYEAPRYSLWVATTGMSARIDLGGALGALCRDEFRWFPTGRGNIYPRFPANNDQGESRIDMAFHGFGFDRFETRRGSSTNDWQWQWRNVDGVFNYTGAGVYGHPKPNSFQLHFIPVVAQGRFWTDLMAAWYFGGAPGYTNYVRNASGQMTPAQARTYSNWVNLGSSYDSLGLGTHWMPPTTHVWNAGYDPSHLNPGILTAAERTQGLKRYPGSMAPTLTGASYLYPMARFRDDIGPANAHFTFANHRLSIRANGLQENWGDPFNPDKSVNETPANARWYDAPNINLATYPVVYGILTPEKIPSMLHRTVVAPHLHWKARYLDAAYRNMHEYKRYQVNERSGTGFESVIQPFWRVYDCRKKSAEKPYGSLHFNGSFAPDKLSDFIAQFKFAKFNPLHYINEGMDRDFNGNGNIDDPNEENQIWDWETAYNYDLGATSKDDKGGKAGKNIYNFVGPIPFFWSIHRAYRDKTASLDNAHTFNNSSHRRNYFEAFDPTDKAAGSLVWYGKMDFISPDPLTGLPQDDVFVDSRYDLSLYDRHEVAAKREDINQDGGLRELYANPDSRIVQRPQWGDFKYPQILNYADYFNQRNRLIPSNDKLGLEDIESGEIEWRNITTPDEKWARKTNTDILLNFNIDKTIGISENKYVQGKITEVSDKNYVRQLNQIWHRSSTKMSPMYGIPNPDYMLAYPDSRIADNKFSPHWIDQFRRYVPFRHVGDDPKQGGLQHPNSRLFAIYDVYPLYGDPSFPDPKNGGQQNFETNIAMLFNPRLGVPKGLDELKLLEPSMIRKPVVPLIGKDEAWRVTRVGRKYQEIIADEIMDYQINPWWPNPCVHFGFIENYSDSQNIPDNDDIAVPLDKVSYKHFTRLEANVVGDNNGETASTPKQKSLYTLNSNEQAYIDGWSHIWLGYHLFKNEGTIEYQIPEYYAYYNRFWCRPAMNYTRDLARFGVDPADYSSYSALNPTQAQVARGFRYWYNSFLESPTTPALIRGPAHRTEARGIYPITYQYFGKLNDSGPHIYVDAIADFPFNTLEDQRGGEWRTVTRSLASMMAGNSMPRAPARNNPFRHWADFVAFLGHLVYRSPMDPNAANYLHFNYERHAAGNTGVGYIANHDHAKAVRHPDFGVNAFKVCHGPNADPRNRDGFFDGSRIATGERLGPMGGYADAALATSLQGYYQGNAAGVQSRNWSQSIVAIDGHWPISANYGAAPESYTDSQPPQLWPKMQSTDKGVSIGAPAPWSNEDEWRRRYDEWRGRDAAGVRVEHHYISEAAANDVLVSLSNGRIGPIDFDGDGHITMTVRSEGPAYDDLRVYSPPRGRYNEEGTATDFWPLYPFNHWRLKTAEGNIQNAYADPVEYLDVDRSNAAAKYGASRTSPPTSSTDPFWDPRSDPATGENTELWDKLYGVRRAPILRWQRAFKRQVITEAVTSPIKFRSNTFRVTISVELTDADYRKSYGTRRYQRVYSRDIVQPTGGRQVQGPYSGMFIMHENRVLQGVDPYRDWLGVK